MIGVNVDVDSRQHRHQDWWSGFRVLLVLHSGFGPDRASPGFT
jgi:hypothetical protein